MEKLCKILEMELKTYTPVGPKFVLEKINRKILHYIQHDIICQRLGLSKDQTNMFKSFVINALITDHEILSDGYIKGGKYFFFTRIGAANGSSLFYNTNARHERHECNTSNTNATRAQNEGYERDTS